MTDSLTVADLVLARLGTVTSWTVLDGEVRSTPAGPYVVLYDEAPQARAARHVATSSWRQWTGRVVCVGRDAAEARYVADAVLDLLASWRFGGRSDGWLTPIPDRAPVLRDDSVPGDIRFSRTLTFRTTGSRPPTTT